MRIATSPPKQSAAISATSLGSTSNPRLSQKRLQTSSASSSVITIDGFRVLKLQREFLQALLRSPTGTACIDDATTAEDNARSFRDGGKWRGPAIRELAIRELIEPVCDAASRRVVLLSRRPSRHSGTIGLWRGGDAAAIDRFIKQLNKRLSHSPEVTEARKSVRS